MTTITPLIDAVDDLWPAEGPPDGVLDQLVLASHLLGANRAVSNFGGGNTSAKGTATDHTGREIRPGALDPHGRDLAAGVIGRAALGGRVAAAEVRHRPVHAQQVGGQHELLERLPGHVGRPEVFYMVDDRGDGAHAFISWGARSRAARST